jgi:GTP cyclohydrolase I
MQIQKAISHVCEKNAGVAVLVSATHTCACLRGVKHDGCAMKTSKLSGSFYDDEKTRAEFYHFVDSWNRSPSI